METSSLIHPVLIWQKKTRLLFKNKSSGISLSALRKQAPFGASCQQRIIGNVYTAILNHIPGFQEQDVLCVWIVKPCLSIYLPAVFEYQPISYKFTVIDLH